MKRCLMHMSKEKNDKVNFEEVTFEAIKDHWFKKLIRLALQRLNFAYCVGTVIGNFKLTLMNFTVALNKTASSTMPIKQIVISFYPNQ